MKDKERQLAYLTLCYYVQNIDDAVFRGDLQGQRYDNRYTMTLRETPSRQNIVLKLL